MCDHMLIQTVANGLSGWSGTWKKHGWKIGNNEIWGKSMYTDFSKCVKNIKIIVFMLMLNLSGRRPIIMK